MYQLSLWEVALGAVAVTAVLMALLRLRHYLRPSRRLGDKYDGG